MAWPARATPGGHRRGLCPFTVEVGLLRPARAGGTLVARSALAHGRVRHAGRTITIADAEVVNADSKPVAIATGSAMILAERPAALVDPD